MPDVHEFEKTPATVSHRINELLIVSQYFWPETIGSAAYITDLAQWMAGRCENVTVFTGRPFYPGNTIYAGYEGGKRDQEEAFDAHIIRGPTIVPKGGSFKGRLLNEALFLGNAIVSRLKGSVPRSPFVFSLCPSIFSVFAGVLSCQSTGRHIAIIHDIQSGLAAHLGMMKAGPILQILRWLERTILNRVDGIVVLSERMKASLAEQGITVPIEVLPIWVDVESIRPMPKPPGSPPTVMYSGNLGRKQGIEQILDMASVLQEIRPDVRILIRGSGAQADRVRQDIKTRSLNSVHLEDLVPPERFCESLAEADVHLVPQNPTAADFAVPSKVYSIMAAGRPFVCTALTGSTLWDLMEQAECSRCVPPNQPEQFATSVAALLSAPSVAKAMGERGRAYVQTHATKDAVLQRYYELLAGSRTTPALPTG
ncbi:MAG: glycosyltransferase family 4 protein [Hyphomicrobiales bacterium]|nr:glycosyltransferase family 4 protein [Hyphomicrobiales bacterium]